MISNKELKTILQEKVDLLQAESDKLAKIATDKQDEVSAMEVEISKKKEELMKIKANYSAQHEILYSAKKFLKSL